MRSIHSRELIKFFLFKKFLTRKNSRGDHVILTKEGISRPIVIPSPCKSLPVRIVKNNLKTAGLTEEDLLRFLQKRSK